MEQARMDQLLKRNWLCECRIQELFSHFWDTEINSPEKLNNYPQLFIEWLNSKDFFEKKVKKGVFIWVKKVKYFSPKDYYDKNKQVILDKHREYYKKNKEAILSQGRIRGKEYYAKNKENILKKVKDKYHNDKARLKELEQLVQELKQITSK